MFIKNLMIKSPKKILFVTTNKKKMIPFIKKGGNKICQVKDICALNNDCNFGRKFNFKLGIQSIDCDEYLLDTPILIDTLESYNYKLKAFDSIIKLIPRKNRLSKPEREVMLLYDYYYFDNMSINCE